MAGFKVSRRLVLYSLGGVAAAGGLAVGIAAMPYSTLPRARELVGKDGESVLRTWIRLGADDAVTVFVPHVDFGQGSQTAVAMMVAEEMDADWKHMRVEEAPADAAFANGALVRNFLLGNVHVPQALDGLANFGSRRMAQNMGFQITGGSSAVRGTGAVTLAPAGAAARWMLRKAAAQAWGVPLEEVETEASVLHHRASNRSARYGQMAEAAARHDPPGDLKLKERAAYRIVGKTTPRLDLPAKVDGTAHYPHDLRLEGMLYAAARQAPVIGGTLLDVDPAPAMAMRGVKKVVKTGDAVFVVADNTWRARVALDALEPRWNDGANGQVSSGAIMEAMNRGVAGAEFKTDHEAGDAETALSGAATKVEALYTIPFLAHAPMAPPAMAAQIKDGALEIWCAVQNPLGAMREAAKRAGVKEDKVRFHNMLMGGGFGRGGFADYAMHAVDVAKETDGAPVQVSWTREEDMTHDWYRQASVAKLEGGLDAQGRLVAFRNSFSERRDSAEVSALQYEVPNHLIRYVNGLNPVRWGYWRSVDNTLHGFTVECFMDECARAAGKDPAEFRRAHISERQRAVLDRVAEISNWGSAPPEGRARGIALRESFGTVVGQVAEVSVGDNGQVRVHHVWSAADAGLVVNPGNFISQIEGGVIFGLSAALYGEISVENGRVREQNFPDYDMVRMAEAPRQTVSIVESASRIGGGGEPGTPAIAAAVANGVFALTGHRVRELPLRHFDLRSGARRASA
ncbi:MAG: xanthine dehydrogenase family protein molybdopterin-binding subunit [Hyphomonadaceae bacterium]|nr:xanthine dehydrogenase family protein molybdopterin-binding subunit [Hyphomonadaceae bacterium]